jgi:hypothetical protein
MRKTLIEPVKNYWAIVKTSDVKGHETGKAFVETALIEFDNILHLEEFLSNGSEQSGESMGAYSFQVLLLYTDWRSFEHECEMTREINDERNREYYESYNPDEEKDIDYDTEQLDKETIDL